MKWKKAGRIFDPGKVKLPGNCYAYAQSPQTLIFDDFVRVYFSTRSVDKTGKYLSHIAYVDYDKNFRKIIYISNCEVIKLGNLGCFDEHGIFPINPFKFNDNIWAYTCGWSRRIAVPVETSIGLAISSDNGNTFNKLGEGPIISSSQNEPFLVGDPFVKMINNKFYMWYICGTKWIPSAFHDVSPERVYKITYATSQDGINWKKSGQKIISDTLNENECQALPTVIELNGKYHMFFCFREAIDFRTNSFNAYRIGYAFSENLVQWTRDDANAGINLSATGWDSEMQCYPHVFSCNNNIYMLYNGNEFGKFGFGLAVLEKD